MLRATGQAQAALTGPILHHIGLRSVGYGGHSPLDGGSVVMDIGGSIVVWGHWVSWSWNRSQEYM